VRRRSFVIPVFSHHDEGDEEAEAKAKAKRAEGSRDDE
jgi:hypothetical protein